MKPAVADEKYAIYCMRIEPITGSNVYLTSYPRDLSINGNTYVSQAGYDFTGIQSDTSFSASAIDLTAVVDIAGLDRDLIASGVFDNAKVYVFKTTWVTPTEDEEPIGKGIFGKITFKDYRYTVQIMTLIDALNQSVGKVYTASCQKEFGSQTYAGCMLDLADYTVTGTITSVTSNAVFRDSARTEDLDYFKHGYVSITSGDNAGLKAKDIKGYAANGTVTLFEPFYYDIEVGDTYEMVAGCSGTEEDCRTKFLVNNIENFGGYSFVPVKTIAVRGGVDK